MAAETAGVERALGAIGTTFRLMRLYPPTHPAVVEALKQIGEAIPGLAALGTVEWKVGVTGLHWHGQHLLPRNAQIAELAGLLYARGVRAVTLNPGMAPGHVRSEEHTSELQSPCNLVCRLLLEKKKHARPCCATASGPFAGSA